jgi:hypothetical protein
MAEITKILLKNGLMAMINENEDYFKTNIFQSLSLKVNDSINDVKQEFEKKLFLEDKKTLKTKELEYFISFVECFRPGNFNFQDGSNLNITEEDMSLIKALFEKLNPEKRQQMVSTLFESAENFYGNIKFAKKAKGLL